MRKYTTFEDINFDLKRFSLERQIAYEKLKALKGDIGEDLKPKHWIQTSIHYATKYGLIMFVKRMFKRR